MKKTDATHIPTQSPPLFKTTPDPGFTPFMFTGPLLCV